MSGLIGKPKAKYWEVLGDRSQERTITRFLKEAGAVAGWTILDIGCGYGRNLDAMRNAGLSPTGIEVNPDIARLTRERGFTCLHPDDPALESVTCDAILMSHIIEHFDYQSLARMMNAYLDKLKPSGYLVIATPLLSRRFYDNFDHVKPYTPMAIEEMFGRRGAQVQFQARNELELRDLWLRRRPYCLQLFAPLLRREMSVGKLLLGSLNVLLVAVHLLSFRRIGTKDAWVGIYRKC